MRSRAIEPTGLRLGAVGTMLTALLLAGCAEEATTQGGAGAGGSGAGAGGSGAQGATGGAGAGFAQGGDGGSGGMPACVSVSEKAEPTALDIVFLLDWSSSMQGESWEGTTTALQSFLIDPLSAGISAGIVFYPTIKPFFEDTCDKNLYKQLDVPIASLPGNAFPITNSFPADALGAPSPLYGGLAGALMAATARQDAFPDHKVIVVLAADGGYNGCGFSIDSIAAWAKDAVDYNGVKTYVIAVQSADIDFEPLEKIANQGETFTVYDATDIDQFSEKIAEIRAAALGCDFAIPEPPEGLDLVPDEVNVTYLPGGYDIPLTLPRADDLIDCGNQPGWYYDNNANPKKILICPASCSTIQNDDEAEVAVAFGCASVPN